MYRVIPRYHVVGGSRRSALVETDFPMNTVLQWGGWYQNDLISQIFILNDKLEEYKQMIILEVGTSF